MGKTTKTTQENRPPAWALPGLETAGRDALDLYNRRVGFDTYRGPTQADLSDVTLGGMNSLLAATGYQGGPVSNQSINANIPDVEAIMQQILGSRPDGLPVQPPQDQEADFRRRFLQMQQEQSQQQLRDQWGL
jgi:hypothetical protein